MTKLTKQELSIILLALRVHINKLSPEKKEFSNKLFDKIRKELTNLRY